MWRIGVDIGGTFIKAGAVDENHALLSKISIPTETEQGYEHCLKRVALAATMAAEEAGLSIQQVSSVGFGVPGVVNPKTGQVVYCDNLKGWNGVPFLEDMAKLLPNKLAVGNDANCAVLGEAVAGDAKGCDDVVLLTLGTGVGGGVVAQGHMLTGGDGAGMELGHMLLSMDGEPCPCGQRGCIEAYCSVSALIRQTKRAMAQNPDSLMHAYARTAGNVDGRTAFECAKEGDKAALEVVDRYTDYLTAAIASLIVCFRPQTVLIGGGLSNQGDYLLNKLNGKLPERLFSYKLLGAPPIKRALLGNDAGTIGAAYLE